MSEASFGMCNAIGAGMKNKAKVDVSSVVDPSAPSRKWTVQELFSGSLNFTTYYGEGEETWYASDTGDRMNGTPGWDDSKVKERVENQRNVGNCITGGLISTIASWPITFAGWIIDMTTAFTTRMLSGSLICTVDSIDKSGCINILGIIGGENGSEGIIGSLRDSVFSPLATLAFLLCAVWLLYKGLIKREFRASLMGVLWSIVIFIVGFMFMQKPQMLASLPQTVNSSINTCIVGAINGQNCITGTVSAPSSVVGKECQVSSSSLTEGAAMAANAMNCSIWKSFVMDGWAKAQFGMNYNELYLSDAPKGGSLLSNLPEDVSRYGVNLKSAGSANDYINKRVETSSDKVSNLALYQLYISTDMKSEGDPQWNTSVDDPRWFNIVVPAAKNPSVWGRWAGNKIGAMFGAFGTLIIAGLVSFSLISFSFYGLVYMMAGTLLMAFAPFFLLLGIEPSKGRRMFLGWLESVVSSILKFMASSLFVIVALTMYSAVLASTTSGVTAFVGISIMVGVLAMYRKEIVNLLGMTNLGGQKLSNAVGDKISRETKSAKDFATIAGGSAVGSVLSARKDAKAAGVSTPVVKAAVLGAKDGIARQQRRGQNFIGGVARQQASVNKELHKEMDERKRAKEREEAIRRESEEAKREEEARRNQNLGGDGGTFDDDTPTPPSGGGGSSYYSPSRETTTDDTQNEERQTSTSEDVSIDKVVRPDEDASKFYSPTFKQEDKVEAPMSGEDLSKSLDAKSQSAQDRKPQITKEINREINPTIREERENATKGNQPKGPSSPIHNDPIRPSGQEKFVDPDLDVRTTIKDGDTIVESTRSSQSRDTNRGPLPDVGLPEIESQGINNEHFSEQKVNRTVVDNRSKVSPSLPSLDKDESLNVTHPKSGEEATRVIETKRTVKKTDDKINKLPDL